MKKKLNIKLVEDCLTTMLGKVKSIDTDTDFGQADVRFSTTALYERGRHFRKFKSGGIQFQQAGCDEKALTISYLFHKT